MKKMVDVIDRREEKPRARVVAVYNPDQALRGRYPVREEGDLYFAKIDGQKLAVVPNQRKDRQGSFVVDQPKTLSWRDEVNYPSGDPRITAAHAEAMSRGFDLETGRYRT